MNLNDHDPRIEEPYMILDETGKIVDKESVPQFSEEELKYLYRTMVFTRIIDEKAVSYQRQGRMLTYAPNTGQEAAEVGMPLTFAIYNYLKGDKDAIELDIERNQIQEGNVDPMKYWFEHKQK